MVRLYSGQSDKTRVAVYARFSCDKQRDASIEDQIYEAERYCERHSYEIVKVYPDYAMSGRSDDRPQFLQMIEDAQKGAFEVVLVWKMDRFARNMQDQFYHEKILADAGVRLESVKENITGNGIEASMSKGMHAIFAQIRSQQSAEDTMRGMIGKARKCQYLGYKWLGYSHDGDTITIDPATKDIAHEIHTRYLGGTPIKDIMRYVNAKGVRNRNGDPVGYQYITGVLKNWAYAGVYTWGQQKDDRGNVLRDINGQPMPIVRIEGGIPAIVSIDMKERCIERLGFRKHANAKADYMLSGKLHCAICGQPMHGEVCRNAQGISYFRYVCSGKRRACQGALWKDQTEQAIARAIRLALSDASTVELIAEAFAEYRAGKKPDTTIEATKADLKTVCRQRDNLIKAVEDGMPYIHVREKIEKLDAKQMQLERKLDDLERAITEITKEDVLNLLARIADGKRTDREIISAFVSQVRIYEGKAVAVLNFTDSQSTPFEIDAMMKKVELPQVRDSSTMNALVPQSIRKTNKIEAPRTAFNTVPVMLLESGIGIVVSLKAA